MSQVLVWKSDEDGKLFEDKTKYQKHLRKLAAERLEAKKIQRLTVERFAFFDKMGQVSSFEELHQFIVDNWSVFRTNAISNRYYKKIHKDDDQLLDLKFDVFSFDPHLSNSHSCPQRGIQNFDTRADYNKGKPTGYPGWRGRITYSVTKASSFGSDYFRDSPICLGTGGGSSQQLSYDLKIWAADFPVIWEKFCRRAWIDRENNDRQTAWRQLGGTSNEFDQVTEVPLDWVVPDPLKNSWSKNEIRTYLVVSR